MKSKAFVLAFIAILVFQTVCDDSCCKYNQIQVSGQGRASAQSDLANVNVRFSQTGSTAAEAVSKLGQKVNRVIGVLKSNGYGNDAYQTNYFYVFDQYGTVNGTSQVIGKQAQISIMVKVRGPGDLGKNVATLIDALAVIEGINIDNVSFDIFDKTALQTQARADAFKDAKAKAEEYASIAGVTVGRLLSIEDSSYVSSYVSPSRGLQGPRSVRENAGTIVPIGEQELTYTTTLTFALR